MSSLTNHLIRRGVEELQTSIRNAPDTQSKFSPLGLGVVFVTVLVFAFGQFAIQYTYGELIATLAAVEAPSSTAIIRTPPAESEESDHPDAPLLSHNEKTDTKEPQDQEILLVKQKALTSRFCTIRRHLQTHGGRGSRFRGLPVYILNGITLSMLMGLISAVPVHSVLFTILEILAYTSITPLELLWNHIIISTPSQKPAFRRIVPFSTIKRALLPTFLYTCLTKISAQVFFGCYLPLRPTRQTSSHPLPTEPLSLLILLLGLTIFIAIQIPAEIAINRVRASLLSTDEQPIIPFDRSFNGQVIPTEEGGAGVLGLWSAWSGCDMRTRLRVLGVYMKVVAMQISWMLIGAALVFVELRVFGGPEVWEKMSLQFAVRG